MANIGMLRNAPKSDIIILAERNGESLTGRAPEGFKREGTRIRDVQNDRIFFTARSAVCDQEKHMTQFGRTLVRYFQSLI